ncbi:MAG: hypothetical protein JW783_00345 [Bacteroidales bacterium]|nr:hypothetical protein [Bacteroidales bacterium]MBN2748470.1 hypothetical protein [Bacteroidales bacterium]
MTLKSELDVFGALFKQHLNGSFKATLRWVTATSVDWENKTMTATDSDELPYYGVLLGVGMMAVKPVIKTDCLIAIVEGDEASAFLLCADEAELIQFNNGSNGGLVYVHELKENLQKLTARVDAVIDALNNAAPSGTPDGGAALIGTIKAALALITEKEDFTGIESNSITH